MSEWSVNRKELIDGIMAGIWETFGAAPGAWPVKISDGDDQVTLIVGNADGGTVWGITMSVELLDGDRMNAARHVLRVDDLMRTAEFYGMSTGAFTDALNNGDTFDGYKPYKDGPGWEVKPSGKHHQMAIRPGPALTAIMNRE